MTHPNARIPTPFDSMQSEPSGVDFSAVPPPPKPPKVRATPVEKLDDGTTRYSDGSIRHPDGTLAALSPQGMHNVITPEISRQLAEKRRTLTARMTRKKIAAVMSKKLGRDVASGSEAIAEAAAQLFDEIVVNPGDGVRAGDRTKMLVTAAQISDTAMTDAPKPVEGGAGVVLQLNLTREISERVRSVLIQRLPADGSEGLPVDASLPAGASLPADAAGAIDGVILE